MNGRIYPKNGDYPYNSFYRLFEEYKKQKRNEELKNKIKKIKKNINKKNRWSWKNLLRKN